MTEFKLSLIVQVVSIVKFDFVLAEEANPVASRPCRRYFQAAFGTIQE